jgi:hypothetical protein
LSSVIDILQVREKLPDFRTSQPKEDEIAFQYLSWGWGACGLVCQAGRNLGRYSPPELDAVGDRYHSFERSYFMVDAQVRPPQLAVSFIGLAVAACHMMVRRPFLSTSNSPHRLLSCKARVRAMPTAN